NDLATDPGHAKVVERLKGELNEWMERQGDRGLETELDALQRQGKYKNMTREEAVETWRTKGNGRSKDKKKADRKKGARKKATSS
ncbi:MAG: sulfatase atsG, partial [Rubripirellula sp.]